jgi:hypothetical protein
MSNKIARGPYGAYEVLAASYQRNGSSGIGFFTGLVLVVDGEGVGQTLLITTLLSRDPEAEKYDGVPVFVTSADNDLEQHFRGDNFIDAAWAIVDTVGEKWDAMLAPKIEEKN